MGLLARQRLSVQAVVAVLMECLHRLESLRLLQPLEHLQSSRTATDAVASFHTARSQWDHHRKLGIDAEADGCHTSSTGCAVERHSCQLQARACLPSRSSASCLGSGSHTDRLREVGEASGSCSSRLLRN